MKNKDIINLIDKNIPKALMVLGVIGIFTTTYFAVENTFKAVDDIQAAKKKKEEETGSAKLEPKEVIKACAKDYIPTGVALASTVACTACAYSEEARKATVATMAYRTVLDALEDKERFQKKLTAVIGPKKTKQLEEEYANERAEGMVKGSDLSAIETSMYIKPGDKPKLFVDLTQQRMYYATENIIKDAITRFKSEGIDDILHDSFNFVDTYDDTFSKPLNDLNCAIGISSSGVGNVLGYNKSQLETLHAKFSCMKLPNGDLVDTVRYSTPTTIV